MQNYQHIDFLDSIIEDILSNVDQHIESQSLVQKMPTFLAQQIFSLIFQQTKQFAIEPALLIRKGMIEDQINKVPRIAKDNLTPKDMERQVKQIMPPISTMTNDSSKRKLLNMSRKNTLGLSTKLRSSSITSQKKSISSFRQKSIQTKCEILKMQLDIDDQQLVQLRGRTQARLQNIREQQLLNKHKEKSYNQKFEMLSELFQANPQTNFTFGYEGESIQSTIQDNKIQHYMAKATLGALTKKMRDHHLGRNQPIQCQIQVSKSVRQKNHEKVIKPMEMPVMPISYQDLSHIHDVRNYKLHDYKKHFGRKYTRLDQYSLTIVASSNGAHQQKDDIFSERKHLRDSTSMCQQSKISIQARLPARKLALPRLNGKYKVLDRYQQF